MGNPQKIPIINRLESNRAFNDHFVTYNLHPGIRRPIPTRYWTSRDMTTIRLRWTCFLHDKCPGQTG